MTVWRCFVLAAMCCCSGCSIDTDPGPLPKATVDEPQVDFGKVAVGNAVAHTFTIRNQGNADLLLDEPKQVEARPRYEVQCELSSRRIPPGGSATARVSIRPLENSEKLYAGVYIGINGPSRRLRIGGHLVVVDHLVLQRDASVERGVWNLKTGIDGEPVAARGRLYSVDRDRFRILAIKSDNPAIRVQTSSLSSQELGELKAKSGYSVVIGANGMKDVGRFEGGLTITTDISPGGTQRLKVRGVCWGPVRVLNPSGIKWIAETARADLGLFPAKTGKTAALFLIIKAPATGPLTSVTETRSSAPVLSVSAERDGRRSTPSTAWFKLTLKVPPGQPPVSRSRDNPVEVSILSNHPRARTIRLLVQFVSY
jgi:HYDIN/CFA65/VesB-like, Ig-like domain